MLNPADPKMQTIFHKDSNRNKIAETIKAIQTHNKENYLGKNISLKQLIEKGRR